MTLLLKAPENKNEEWRFLLFLCLGLSLFVIFSYILGTKVERGDNSKPSESARGSFPEVVLQARAAYVYDARTKEVLYARNENLRLPLASLTKVMSALVAREATPEYTTVTVDRSALAARGDSGIKPGERWRLRDLLDFSLMTSSNDGMRAVALAMGALNRSGASEDERLNDFVGLMNGKAAELGLNNTYFWNETGLDETEFKGGAYGTAKDMAALMEYVIAYHPGLLEVTKEPQAAISSLDFAHEARNTNALSDRIPGLIGSKTGFTNTAGGNLALAFDPELGRPIIVVVMGSGSEERFHDAAVLINAVLRYITN